MPTSASTLSLGQGVFQSSWLGTDSTTLGTPPDQINVGGTGSPYAISSKIGSTIENLTLDTANTFPQSSSNVTFSSAVDGLKANLGDGADTLTMNSQVFASTIEMDATANASNSSDRFVASNGFFGSSVSTGAGNDTLIFSKEIIDSTVNTGAGNDVITFQSGSSVSNTSVSTGAGNDSVIFNGAVFGNGDLSQIRLGIGADTLVFGANSYVQGYSIDLGASDGNIDIVRFGAGLVEDQNMEITGAGTEDILFIGSTQYAYDGVSGDFISGSTTITWLT